MSQTRIRHCLCVRDEAPIIKRSLDAIINLASEVLIHDTDGISEEDNETVKAIKEWSRDHPEVKIILRKHNWIDFGFNKTQLLKEAQNLEPIPDYVSFIDADEVFTTDVNDPTKILTVSDVERLLKEMDSQPEVATFQFQTHYLANPPRKYFRWQIIRNNQRFTWYLPIQEILIGESNNLTRNINWIFNYSRPDGNSSRHPERVIWAISILKEWLIKMEIVARSESQSSEEGVEITLIPRVTFYLARYLIGSFIPEAIETFRKRIAMGAEQSPQEVYISYLTIGRNLQDPKEAKKAFVKATELDPNRLEAFYELTNRARFAKNWREALGWAMMAPNIRVPLAYTMMAEMDIYNWRFDYVISIVAWQAAQPKLLGAFDNLALYKFGEDACLRSLIHAPDDDRGFKATVQDNYTHYKARVGKIFGSLVPSPLSLSLPASSSTPVQQIVSFQRPPGSLFPDIFVIDNFYPDPFEMRTIALSSTFEVKGNYPGLRTKPFQPSGIKEKIEGIVGHKITYWPAETDEKGYNGAFQLAVATDRVSWIHRDRTHYSLVVYLSPNAPADSGTIIYRHKSGIIKNNGSDVLEKMLLADKQNLDMWNTEHVVTNRFNRAIIFKGAMSHMNGMGGVYFGDSLETGRLTQTFFFNVVGGP